MRTKAVEWCPETEQETASATNQFVPGTEISIVSRSVATSGNVRASGLRKYQFAVQAVENVLNGPKRCVPNKPLRIDHETGCGRRRRTVILTRLRTNAGQQRV